VWLLINVFAKAVLQQFYRSATKNVLSINNSQGEDKTPSFEGMKNNFMIPKVYNKGLQRGH